MYRKSNRLQDKNMYVKHKNYFKTICNNSKTEYYNKIIDKINKTKSSKEFWDAIRTFKRSININGEKINLKEWTDYFKKLYNPPLISGRIQYDEPLRINYELDRDFTMDELLYVINKRKNNKQPGVDGIPYEFFKFATPPFLEKLLNILNKMFEKGKLPDCFKQSIIFPLYKKGDRNEVTNYRGISFINTISKIYAGLINERLCLWANSGIITEFQAGFRQNYSTMDNLFNLINIVKIHTYKKRKKIYAFFIDLSAAFDTVDRHALIYKLICLGLSSKIINSLKDLHKKNYRINMVEK